MRILLDTHLLLWAAGFPKRLSPQAREIIGSSGNAIFFSVASLWEIEIKATLGREDFRVETVGFRRGLIENDYLELPISGEHVLSLRHLPSLHRDPFDRILLDLPEPWAALPHLPSVLRPGGLLLSWVPTPLQVHTLSLKLKDSGIFHLVQTVETIVRDWEFGPTSVRPAHRIIGHTGYLTVARKSARGLPYIPWEPPF